MCEVAQSFSLCSTIDLLPVHSSGAGFVFDPRIPLVWLAHQTDRVVRQTPPDYDTELTVQLHGPEAGGSPLHSLHCLKNSVCPMGDFPGIASLCFTR